MLKARLQKFIALLLLLAFTSQTLATATMNCEQGESPSDSTNAVTVDMSMSDMDMDMDDPTMMHMHHSMSEIDHSHNTHQPFDCCKTMGHCLFGGCTLAAANNDIIFLLSNLNSVAQDFYLGIAPNPLASSRYRPPISC